MKIHRVAAGLVAGTVVLAGCAGTSGDSDDGGGNGASGELSAVPGFDPADGTIHVGVIVPLSGPLGVAGKDILLGTQIYVDRINEAGGIAGEYPIEIVSADSEFDPQAALAAYNGMAEDVTLFAAVLGAGIISALLPAAAQDDSLIIPASDNSEWLREPNVIPVRPHYEATIANGLAYANEQVEGQRFCAIYQDDPTGESVIRGVDHAVEEMDLDYAGAVSFAIGTTDFTPQVSQLKSDGCEVVAFGGTSANTANVMASAVQLDFAPQWVGLTNAFQVTLLGSPVYDYLNEHFLVASAGTEWGDTSVEGMEQLMADFDKYAPEGSAPSSIIPGGYQFGFVLEAILEEAVERGDLSHESILDISHSDLQVDFKGLYPDIEYGPVDERQSPSAIAIFGIDQSATGGLKTVERDYDSEAAQSFEVE